MKRGEVYRGYFDPRTVAVGRVSNYVATLSAADMVAVEHAFADSSGFDSRRSADYGQPAGL